MASALPSLPTDSRMGAMVRDFDWAAHPFGPPESWGPELRLMVATTLRGRIPLTLYWGEDRRIVFNDASIISEENAQASLGARGEDVWGEWWPPIAAQIDKVWQTKREVLRIDDPFVETGSEGRRTRYWSVSYTPVDDADGNILGVLVGARETTASVFRRRANALIAAIDAIIAADPGPEALIERTLQLIGEDLEAKRVGLGEIDPGIAALTINHVWSDGGMAPTKGTYPLGTFGRISEDLAAGKSVRIEDNRADPRTADPAVLAAYDRFGLRASIIVPILDLGRYAGGLFVQDNEPRRWTDAEMLLVERATARLWPAVVRSRAESRLRDSEERYRLIFEQANDIIFTADLDQVITDCNEAGAAALGLPRGEIIGRNIAEFVNAKDFAQTTAMLRQKIERGGHTRHEVGVNRPDGTTVRWENDSTLVIDPDGFPMGLLSISRDVTEQRAFEDRQQLLIHELNHRVKNTLSLVQALAQQSFRGRAESAVFAARLQALAVAHDLLTREQWEGVSLAEIAFEATCAVAGGRIDVTGGPPVALQPKQAIAITMALHELATNATKYGALSVDGGRVRLDWTVGNGRFRLCWRECGGPPAKPPEKKGFGLRMIERALASDLSGSVTMSFEESGLSCTIDAPLPHGGG